MRSGEACNDVWIIMLGCRQEDIEQRKNIEYNRYKNINRWMSEVTIEKTK